MFGASFAAFIISCAVYGGIASMTYTGIKSQFDYFHTRRERNGIVVLVLGSLTLGTGLLYISELAVKNPFFAILAPFSVFIGYGILALYTNLLKKYFDSNNRCHSYLDFIRNTTNETNNRATVRVINAYVIMQAIVYLLLCAFELYASSQLYIALTTPETGETWVTPLGVAFTLLAVAIFYTWSGGIRAAIGTDLVQAVFIVLSIIALLIVLLLFPSSVELHQQAITPDAAKNSLTFFELVMIAFSVIVNAVMTQFYSALNVSISTNYDASVKVKVFLKSGGFIAVSLLLFAVIGIISAPYYQSNMGNTISTILNSLSNAGGIFVVFSVLVVAGFVALQLSTLDGTIVVVQQALWELYNPGITFIETTSTQNVFLARIGTLVIGIFIFFLTYLFYQADVAFIPLALTVVWPLTISAPIFAISAYYSARHGASIVSSQNVQVVMAILVFGSWGTLLFTTMKHQDFTAIGSVFVCIAALGYFMAERYTYRRTLCEAV